MAADGIAPCTRWLLQDLTVRFDAIPQAQSRLGQLAELYWEGLCRPLGRPVLISGALAAATDTERPVGARLAALQDPDLDAVLLAHPLRELLTEAIQASPICVVLAGERAWDAGDAFSSTTAPACTIACRQACARMMLLVARS